MNIRQQLEILTLVSAHSDSIIDSRDAVPKDAVHRYWSLSRARLGKWFRELDAAGTQMNGQAADVLLVWEHLEPLLCEVICSELVTRVWGAILAACDHRRGTADTEPYARSILITHTQARQKVLQRLMQCPETSLPHAARIERIRRRIERWTDLLLGHIAVRHQQQAYAFDPDRAVDFGEEQTSDNPGGGARLWDYYLLSLRVAFPEPVTVDSQTDEFRKEIVKTILASFPDQAFRPDGTFLPPHVYRLMSGPVVNEGPGKPLLILPFPHNSGIPAPVPTQQPTEKSLHRPPRF